MYKVSVSEQEIEDAQNVWDKEWENARSRGWKNVFFHKNGWSGKLGEIAVQRRFPHLTKITENLKPTTFDFLRHGELCEVKTRNGNHPPRDNYLAIVNERQLQNHEYQSFVFCYFDMKETNLYIVGWIDRIAFDNDAEVWLRGEMWPFGVEVSYDCRSFRFGDLYSLDRL